MSSELHKYIETSLEKKNLVNAKLISFPQDKSLNNSTDFDNGKLGFWKLYDKSHKNEDGDQLRAVTGICFMFTVLVLLGLYSNFV
tara:strand:- start:516 stop:770 length:255 start_codon:yes stop_codon:yes gene_type:complete